MGFLLLIPALAAAGAQAQAPEFDKAFYAMQALELVAGATNIALLAVNIRDRLKLKGWLHRKPA